MYTVNAFRLGEIDSCFYIDYKTAEDCLAAVIDLTSRGFSCKVTFK